MVVDSVLEKHKEDYKVHIFRTVKEASGALT